jgi:hypothetical protein
VLVYVSKLPGGTTARELTALFAQFGTVAAVTVWDCASSGKRDAIGFVNLRDPFRGAIAALDGSNLRGWTIAVQELNPDYPLSDATAAMA